MADVIEGDVVGETVNLQVVRRPKGTRPRFVVQHLQSGQTLSLLDLIRERVRWEELVMSDKDAAEIQKCRRYVAKALTKDEAIPAPKPKGYGMPEWLRNPYTNAATGTSTNDWIISHDD